MSSALGSVAAPRRTTTYTYSTFDAVNVKARRPRIQMFVVVVAVEKIGKFQMKK